jgi:hypothetical protein
MRTSADHKPRRRRALFQNYSIPSRGPFEVIPKKPPMHLTHEVTAAPDLIFDQHTERSERD